MPNPLLLSVPILIDFGNLFPILQSVDESNLQHTVLSLVASFNGMAPSSVTSPRPPQKPPKPPAMAKLVGAGIRRQS